MNLKGCHVVESQVQLLTEGFALQLLSIHLICISHTHTHSRGTVEEQTHRDRRKQNVGEENKRDCQGKETVLLASKRKSIMGLKS